jgi:GTP 3',8-cyclase
MLDNYNRKINYLRISVTDRCNLRCIYCMPEEGIEQISHSDILSFEEIAEFSKCAVEMGIDKVRITGGEPLVRKGIVNLVKMLAGIDGIKDLSMTTNAILLAQHAKELRKAGLQRINISLDTINPEKYKVITRGGNLQYVLEGIQAAQDSGLSPVKINCVIKKYIDEPEALAVREYCEQHGLEARFIYEMDIEKGEFGIVRGGSGGDCANCNRLRLTSDGNLKPCLFNDISINIRKVDYKTALHRAIELKPECGVHSTTHKFYNIGG